MVSKAAVIRQAILLSGAICVFPMVLYPATLGLPKFSVHPVYLFAEWTLYFLLYLALLSRMSVSRRFIAAGVTVVYRLSLCTLFGSLIAAIHGLPLWETVRHSVWEYPPALILHLLFAPFILRPLYNKAWDRRKRFALHRGHQKQAAQQSRGFSFPEHPTSMMDGHSALDPGDISFDAATAWIGDYSGVRACLLVSGEGLVISHWAREAYSQDAEYWAAVSMEMVRFHHHWPTAGDNVNLRRLEVETDSGKLTVRQAGQFWLVILTEAEAGELVTVRVTQAVDMIEKHYQNRYSALCSAGLEVAHA